MYIKYLFYWLFIQILLVQGQEKTVEPVAYNTEFVGGDSILENARSYVQYIKKSQAIIVVFPEYGLTPRASKDLQNPLSCVILPNGIEKNICNTQEISEQNYNQKSVTLIACGAKEFRKHVIIHILERYDKNCFSTIVHIDKNGVLRNLYRKEMSSGEKSDISLFKENQKNVFKIEDLEYTIIMNYGYLTNYQEYDRNIIYFDSASLSSNNNCKKISSLSKKYNWNVYAPVINNDSHLILIERVIDTRDVSNIFSSENDKTSDFNNTSVVKQIPSDKNKGHRNLLLSKKIMLPTILIIVCRIIKLL